jgi:hypothetical protein
VQFLSALRDFVVREGELWKLKHESAVPLHAAPWVFERLSRVEREATDAYTRLIEAGRELLTCLKR